MQITIIFIGILFIVGLVYFGMKLNNYSEEKYDYRPINIFNAGIMMIAFILIICGYYFFKHNETKHETAKSNHLQNFNRHQFLSFFK